MVIKKEEQDCRRRVAEEASEPGVHRRRKTGEDNYIGVKTEHNCKRGQSNCAVQTITV